MQKNYRIQPQPPKGEDKNVGTSCSSILRWKIRESSKGKEKITQPSKQDKSYDCIPKYSGKTQPRTQEKEKNQYTSSSRTNKGAVYDCIQKFSGKTQSSREKEKTQPCSRINKNKGSVFDCIQKFSGKTQSSPEKEKTQPSSSSRFVPRWTNKKTVCDYIQKISGKSQQFSGKTQPSKDASESGNMQMKEQSPSPETATTNTQEKGKTQQFAAESGTMGVNTQEKEKAQTDSATATATVTTTTTTSSREKEKTQHTAQPKESQKAQTSKDIGEYDNHIVWKGCQEPKIEERCCLCEGDLTYKETAVLCCGHVFHNNCFQFATYGENSTDPRCTMCTNF